MRCKKPKSNRQTKKSNDDYDFRMRKAVEALRGEKNYRKVADKFNVSHSTLYKHIHYGQQSRSISQAHRQVLTVAEEKVLAYWVVFYGAIGDPLSKEELTAKANDILAGRTAVGHHWYRGFIERHQDLLVFTRTAPLDAKRASAFNRTTVEAHFRMYKSVKTNHQIPVPHFWNMDEKGLQVGGGRRGSRRRYFYSRAQKNKYRTKSDSLELVTIIEVICADGTAPIGPGFIVSNDDLGEWWDMEEVGSVALTDNGWTDRFVGEKWFIEVFIPQAKEHRVSDAPVVLLFDGHSSHLTNTMKTAEYNNGIFLICLPPKTTHRLQPLDVGIFNLVQAAWIKRCEDLAARYTPVQRHNVIENYLSVRGDAFTEKNIQSAWRRTGHEPLNEKISTEEDYAPSIATSIITHVPQNYPDAIPSSPESSVFTDEESERTTESSDSPVDDPQSSAASIGDIGPLTEVDLHDEDMSDRSFEGSGGEETTEFGQGSEDSAMLSQTLTRSRAHNTKNRHGKQTPQQVIEAQQVSIGMLKAKLEAANAHCTLMKRENQELKTRFEAMEQAKKKGKSSKKTNPFQGQKTGFLTQPEAKARHEQLVAEEAAAAQAKAQKEMEKEQQEAEVLASRALRACDETFAFTGSIASYKQGKVDNLRDLAAALGIQWKGVKKLDLFEAVTHHFDANPELKTNSRFTQLFRLRQGA